MATGKKKSQNTNHTNTTTQAKKVIIMRKNQKVARVSLCCKLNMLVPHLQSLSARMQHEKNEKGRTGTANHK